MIAQINDLIDAKLTLLLHAPGQVLPVTAFKRSSKSRLQDAKILADMMQQKNLIIAMPGKELYYQLSSFGKQICENGGWITHLEQHTKQKPIVPKTIVPEEKSWKQSLKSILSSLITNR